ncbi:MAG: hypothetical protein Q8P29_02715 [Candidatus Levybacteria bacterium]|nr:hypothetical protein [Candidatus Levybacteria bacterium]
MKDKIASLLNEIRKQRKNPLLLLNLSEVSPASVLKIEQILRRKRYKKLDVLLQTNGGDIHSAYNIVKLLRKSSDLVNIIVPLFAKSAGTLISLCGDKIIMSDISELGPLDTQIAESRRGDFEYRSALNGFKALEQIQLHALENIDLATKMIIEKSGLKVSEAIELAIKFSGDTSACLYDQLDPMDIGEYKRALEIVERYGHIILLRYMKWTKEKAHKTSMSLIYDYPSHDSIIDKEELSELGLPIEEIKSDQLDNLSALAALLPPNEDFIEILENKQRKK